MALNRRIITSHQHTYKQTDSDTLDMNTDVNSQVNTLKGNNADKHRKHRMRGIDSLDLLKIGKIFLRDYIC